MKHSWDQYANIELVDAAIAHSYSWIYQNFLEKINLSTKNEKVRAVLTKLLLVYGLEKILERAQHYFETGTVTASTLKAATELRAELLA